MHLQDLFEQYLIQIERISVLIVGVMVIMHFM